MTPQPQTPDPDEVVEALAWVESLPVDDDVEKASRTRPASSAR